ASSKAAESSANLPAVSPNDAATPSMWQRLASRWIAVATPLLPLAVVLWVIGACVLALRLAMDLRAATRLRREAIHPPSNELADLVLRLGREEGISRPVAVRVSARVDSPAVVGVRRPVVLLPMRRPATLTDVQLELVLAHELAHVKRHDQFLNLAQAAAEVVFFYQPLVWWISRVLRDTREECCDVEAARRRGGEVE